MRLEVKSVKGIVLIGPPCCGKSTICDILCNKLGKYAYISSGDIARKMAQGNAEAMESLNAGNMAPEDEMRSRVINEIYSCIKRGEDFILDGFPRNMDQVKYLMECGICLQYIKLVVADDVIIRRAKRRMRSDDVSVMKRLKYYKENTEPIIHHVGDYGVTLVMCGDAEYDAYKVHKTIQRMEGLIHADGCEV